MKGHTYKRCPCGVLRDRDGRRINCQKKHGSWYYAHEISASPQGKRRQTFRGRSLEADAPRGRGLVVDVDDRRVLDHSECGIHPLDKRHGIRFDVVLELEYVALFDPFETVEVQVVDDHPPPVLESLISTG